MDASKKPHGDRELTSTCFSDLPAELRLKIWRFALPGPRIITIISHDYIRQPDPQNRDSEEILRSPRQITLLHSSAKPPALLHVNLESREVALAVYTLSLRRLLGGRPVYANLDLDTLYIRDNKTFAAFFGIHFTRTQAQEEEVKELFRTVRSVMVEEKWLRLGIPGQRRLIRNFLSFRNLKSLTILEDSEDDRRDQTLEQIRMFSERWKEWAEWRGADAKSPKVHLLSKAAMQVKFKESSA